MLSPNIKKKNNKQIEFIFFSKREESRHLHNQIKTQLNSNRVMGSKVPHFCISAIYDAHSLSLRLRPTLLRVVADLGGCLAVLVPLIF